VTGIPAAGRGLEMAMSDQTVIRGSRPQELPRPNRTYARGRVCEQEGCQTRLSVYNQARYCWQHAPVRFPLVRGQRRKKAAA
jgi:hypothetical protein